MRCIPISMLERITLTRGNGEVTARYQQFTANGWETKVLKTYPGDQKVNYEEDLKREYVQTAHLKEKIAVLV